MLLLLSCIAFISHSVPTTVNSEGYLQTSNNMLKNLELYNLSFLKLTQLIVDGDVESNPGPVTNRVDNTPTKGRPTKKRFRGTPIKQKTVDFNISSNIRDTNVRDPNIPLGLLNNGENVCFFNSVIQSLYSITAFRDYILQLLLFRDNPPAVSIKNLFREIASSNNHIRTSEYLKHLELLDFWNTI